MANWHALEGSDDGNSFRIAFHIAIPAGNNRVSVSYRTALIASGIGGTTILVEGVGPGQIATAEKAQIAAGEVYEHIENVVTNPGETAAALQARITAMHTALATSVRDRLQRRLTYFGHTQ